MGRALETASLASVTMSLALERGAGAPPDEAVDVPLSPMLLTV